jgi:hypothetical protein
VYYINQIMMKIMPAILLFLLSACGGGANSQSVKIKTDPEFAGTKCNLGNGRGLWSLDSVPGSVSVIRSKSDLVIKCSSPTHQGQVIATAGVEKSTTLPIAEASTGALFVYKDEIVVPMYRSVADPVLAPEAAAKEE